MFSEKYIKVLDNFIEYHKAKKVIKIDTPKAITSAIVSVSIIKYLFFGFFFFPLYFFPCFLYVLPNHLAYFFFCIGGL
jgi:hypothetical protein